MGHSGRDKQRVPGQGAKDHSDDLYASSGLMNISISSVLDLGNDSSVLDQNVYWQYLLSSNALYKDWCENVYQGTEVARCRWRGNGEKWQIKCDKTITWSTWRLLQWCTALTESDSRVNQWLCLLWWEHEHPQSSACVHRASRLSGEEILLLSAACSVVSFR